MQNETTPEPVITTGNVITADDLRAIREDIRNISVPSWVQSVPSDLGDASHGKLKADEWRSLACLYALIPLMRLWTSASGKRAAALHLTFTLVSAIVIATSRVTSSKHVDVYLDLMTAYAQGLKEHFPDFEFHPNHHLAFHLAEFLIQYGPIHEWWTFPFERIIGMLQRVLTNDKMGTLSCTALLFLY